MYNWLKDIAQWKIGKTLYLSVVFSWDIVTAISLAQKHKGKVVAGGPAAVFNREKFDGIAEVRESCQEVEPILFHNPLATFTSRGCPNHCSFCAVPKIEGDFHELEDFRPAPVVCDNNFLAASRTHQERVIDALADMPYVDFNQGLDTRRFNSWSALLLGRLRMKARFAFDHVDAEGLVADAIKLCRKHTTKDISVYVLIGYKDTPDDALYRLEKVREWGIRPNPMRYQPLDAPERNSYLGSGWTEQKIRRVCRYYSRLRWLEHIPFAEYRPRSESLFE